MEKTLSIIKPDAMERNLEDKIKNVFIRNNFEIVRERKVKLEKKDAEQFYKVHETKPFYNDLCNYLSSGPVLVMVLQKENAIAENRKIMGATNPDNAETGTIRKEFALNIQENSVHGSDSEENAEIEIKYFYDESEYIDYLKQIK